MRWNGHSNLKGQHALFAPSQSISIINAKRPNEAVDKAMKKFYGRDRVQLGTELHDFADTRITLNEKITSKKQLIFDIKDCLLTKYKALDLVSYGMRLVDSVHYLPDDVFDTLTMYINDAIGFKLDTEITLYYSEHFFGTADAIGFSKNTLRIHDLKTGDRPAHMEQLLGYAALFCLEYNFKPSQITTELRLYQHGDVIQFFPTVEDLLPVIDNFVTVNEAIKKEEEINNE